MSETGRRWGVWAVGVGAMISELVSGGISLPSRFVARVPPVFPSQPQGHGLVKKGTDGSCSGDCVADAMEASLRSSPWSWSLWL